MNAHQELAIQALNNMRGDNLPRARNSFRNCTQAQMQQEYGQSGSTRAQIIESCEEHELKVNKAIAWVKNKI